MRNLISGCSAGRGSRTSVRGHGQSQTNRFLPASAPDVRMGRQQQPPCAPSLLPFLPGAWSWGGRSEGELGGAHRVPTVLLPQQGTPLQSPCSPGRSAQGVNVMGERKDVVLHGTLSLPEPEPRGASSSRWSWLWCSVPGRLPSTKPLLTEHRRARAAARAHPGDVLTGYIWLMPGLMSSGGLGG